MSARPHVQSATAISIEVDRLTIPQRKKRLPSTFLSSFAVIERLGDLDVCHLPSPSPSVDKVCAKHLTEADISAVKLANDALLLFSRLAYLVDHGDATLRSMMLQMWSATGVWKWILFLYNAGQDLNDTIANADRPLPMTRQTITLGIVDVLVGCADSVSLGKQLLLVSDLVSLIGKLWVENLEIPNRPNMVHQELTFTMYHIMNDDTANGAVIATLVGGVDGGAKTIMDAVTEHFRRLSSAVPLDAHRIEEQVHFIEFLVKNPMLRDAMHEVDTLSVAIMAIGALANKSVDSCKTAAHEVAETCVGLLLFHLLSGPNVRSLIQAVNDGLLRTLYDARVAFDAHNGCCDAIEEVVLSVIAPSLVFRSVLHAVERSESKTGFFKSYNSTTTEWIEWDTLYEVYQDTIIFRHDTDQLVDSRPCGRKDAIQCPTRSFDTVKLQRCARCQYRRYCSRECQQQDWPEHKRYCLKESEQEITPVSDREFARELAEWEVKIHMGSIRKRIQKNPELKNSTGDLMLQVDFSTLDKNIAIGLAPGHTKPGKSRVAAIYAKVQSGRVAVRSLGLVSDWSELQESAKVGALFGPVDESFAEASKKSSKKKKLNAIE
ncbi:hypothetical protein B0H10DRAFT_2430190 [Mycena sp. CBHHK59/15]|nr:hypothetical protein B0H10DRAFT_2430190 [Mycena sp. CBHHK59/15]